MTIPDSAKLYPRSGDRQTIYLRNAVQNPMIEIGAFTIYNDFARDPTEFQRNNVLYHYPVNGDRLKIGKFCSIACGAKFLMNSANHAMGSLFSGRTGAWKTGPPMPGTTGGTSWWGTTCGLVTRR